MLAVLAVLATGEMPLSLTEFTAEGARTELSARWLVVGPDSPDSPDGWTVRARARAEPVDAAAPLDQCQGESPKPRTGWREPDHGHRTS